MICCLLCLLCPSWGSVKAWDLMECGTLRERGCTISYSKMKKIKKFPLFHGIYSFTFSFYSVFLSHSYLLHLLFHLFILLFCSLMPLLLMEFFLPLIILFCATMSLFSIIFTPSLLHSPLFSYFPFIHWSNSFFSSLSSVPILHGSNFFNSYFSFVLLILLLLLHGSISFTSLSSSVPLLQECNSFTSFFSINLFLHVLLLQEYNSFTFSLFSLLHGTVWSLALSVCALCRICTVTLALSQGYLTTVCPTYISLFIPCLFVWIYLCRQSALGTNWDQC